RAADCLEHFGGRRLLLQRFMQLVEQPGVFDRNDGLIREILDQLDLLVSEWLNFRTRQSQNADWPAFAQHRNTENRTEVAEPLRLGPSVISRNAHIRDVNGPTFQQG